MDVNDIATRFLSHETDINDKTVCEQIKSPEVELLVDSLRHVRICKGLRISRWYLPTTGLTYTEIVNVLLTCHEKGVTVSMFVYIQNGS